MNVIIILVRANVLIDILNSIVSTKNQTFGVLCSRTRHHWVLSSLVSTLCVSALIEKSLIHIYFLADSSLNHQWVSHSGVMGNACFMSWAAFRFIVSLMSLEWKTNLLCSVFLLFSSLKVVIVVYSNASGTNRSRMRYSQPSMKRRLYE